MGDMKKLLGDAEGTAADCKDLCMQHLRSQKFFAELAAETRRPHFGDQAREWVRSLLVRAQEAGLYTPEGL